MNSIRGTYQLVFDELKWYFKIFSLITLLLSVVYVLVSIIFKIPLQSGAALFGPTYGGISTFAVAGLVIPFQVAIGLGSTRRQFLKSYIVMSLLMVITSITYLNILYYIMNILLDKGINSFHFYHPAQLVSSEYHFFTYYWVDLMVGFMILGLSSFIAILVRRLGILYFLMTLVLVSILMTFLSINGISSDLFSFILNSKPLNLFTLIGLIGIVLQILTFPMMLNAPLKMKGRN
ncbi:hypothetical protein AN960_02215 [Bacillus sp. FJAT-25509]|uniref:hypothetical protein n=1 Tax=Bacillus sp. FJAT-25509 TaxID=1712029 RepID=UPI0006F9BCA7|nr:hypothetical protein [Bacillus sp. FJAT-25509]KQL42086.1 hypothetical protein AN960_02215 [Bacillus sp. FJAT-25509]